MKEDNIDNLRQMDASLREAIRQEEMQRPQLAPDLNARLLQRVAEETADEPKRKRVVWPWVAAACVAAVLVVFLTPPKSGEDVTGQPQIAETVRDTARDNAASRQEPFMEEQPQPLLAEDIQPSSVQQPKVRKPVAAHEEQTMPHVDELPAEQATEEVVKEAPTQQTLAAAEEPQVKEEPRMLTERDIPITRPENLRYTKEEIALLKRQANEAYLKWMELELEISKYNLEQTAAK